MFYDYSNRESVKFINLQPYLLQYNNEKLYFEADGHWTAIGNKRVAEGILNDPVFIETIKKGIKGN